MAYFDWDYSEEEREADRRWMWEQEHFADTCYVLGVETFLTFVILSNLNYSDYENEFLEFSLENERDVIQAKIMNCGKPVVRYTFNEYQFREWARKYPEWVTQIDDDKFRLNLKQFFYGWDNLSAREKELLGDDPVRAKKWCLVCNMQLNFARIETIVLGTFRLGFLYN